MLLLLFLVPILRGMRGVWAGPRSLLHYGPGQARQPDGSWKKVSYAMIHLDAGVVASLGPPPGHVDEQRLLTGLRARDRERGGDRGLAHAALPRDEDETLTQEARHASDSSERYPVAACPSAGATAVTSPLTTS